ncbi:cytochrome P450 [Paraliomyxa miuraensis]|uniref:cytochrome P450 n=1 Tax=Paraliomyxa miuraensis TaxID=376150 RepID=UPI00224E3A40|nr:cytochrome P450 [Paraliomyxa miuraensis]MCX4239272.1 cytochrome P450 [Paraliomyxa miuraensis]
MALTPKRPTRPRGYPLIGQLPGMTNAPALFLQLAARHPGEVIEVGLGVSSIFLTTHPDHAQRVLMDNYRNYTKQAPMWRPLRRFAGNGLLTAEGDSWLRNRRLIQPLFGSKQLTGLAEQMIEVAEQEAERLSEHVDGAPIDMDLEMITTTQRIILATMFGTSLPQQQLHALAQAVLDSFKAINIRMLLYFVPDVLLPGERTLRQSLATIDQSIAGLIAERRRRPAERDDLLSLLLAVRDEDGEAMSDRQLRDELVTMFVAGNETTAITMTWLFHLLDQNPEVDARVRAELDAVLGDDPLTPENIRALDYCRRAVQEAHRMYPPSWLIPRRAEQADEVGGYAIPAGATVVVSQYVLHHDASTWESPEVFDPDRFLPERVEQRSRYSYIPFGSGPRQCIGNNFAVLEALIILAAMHRRMRARLVPGHVVVPQAALTLRPKHGLKMTLHPV